MSSFRTRFFLFCFYGWTAVWCLIGLGAMALPRRYLTKLLFIWSQHLVWIERTVMGLTYRVTGLENIPQGPCLIAAKHQSAWETCKMFLILGDPAIVLKEELTRLPILKAYANATGMIPIDRGGRVRTLSLMMKAAQKAVAEGRKIVIFPQGTRLAPGEKKSYKSGVAALYQELNVPIVPMALNSGLFWPKRGAIRPGCITVEFLPPIPPGLSRAEMMDRLAVELDAASDRLAGIAPEA